MSEILDLGGGRFISKLFFNKLAKLEQRFAHELMFGVPDDIKEKREYRKQFDDNLKMAYIKQGNEEFMAWVDNVTMKAYKNDSFYYYKKTNIEIKNFEFVRWMRGMDV